MEINFDLLISGCNTRCRHCYVNGGPGRNISLEDALLCIERLDELGALLGGRPSFTLDNEPLNHPDIKTIVRTAASTKHVEHFHHGMTTGIALMRHPDRERVVQTYLDLGLTDWGITLHGAPAHHDEITRRPGSFEYALEAAEFLKMCGAKLSVSLMLNRFFPEDAGEITKVLEKLSPEFVWFAVPNYTPHENMPGFEPYRASFEDLCALEPHLTAWGQDKDALLRNAARHTAGAVLKRFTEGLTLKKLFSKEQHELYCSVHQDRRLYIGNTGVETVCLGDLRSLDLHEAADAILRASGNRDYGAFYDVEALPDDEALMAALRALPEGLLYSDTASVISRALADLDTPTKLLGV